LCFRLVLSNVTALAYHKDRKEPKRRKTKVLTIYQTKEDAMAKCGFCHRSFQSPQAVKAHLKHCKRYEASPSKKACALGTKPKAAITPAALPPVQSIPSIEAPDFSAQLRESSQKQKAPSTPQQRREIIQAAKTQIIDRYRPSSGTVTVSMRGFAKMLIERELASLPLEQVPFEEVLEFAAAMRDRFYEPAFRLQARETERQHATHETRRRKQIKDMAAGHRADCQKTTLIEQAIGQARARCAAQQILGRDRLRVLIDIGSRLKALLTGSESVPDAQVIIRTVLDARFAEAEATLAAAQAKATEQWYEEIAAVVVIGTLAGFVVLAIKYPAQALPVLNWIERIFGLTPGAEAAAPTPETAKTTPSSASVEARPPTRRRRKDPVAPSSSESPWGNAVGIEPAHA
jgi:hypothetical protein